MASTTKRAWKLQEFVAHSGNVNCLALGHKSGRVMVTGGDDKKVNMWAVGKPNCVLSLSGHTSPVEAVRFGSDAEDMVVAGSQSGALKIWDLDKAKIMRTLTGHKSNIRSLDFHPFGDFVASGSKDTNIKLWDIRRKGCIFTYKGHTGTVNCLRFSPDGRWIASAGDDHRLKLWDLAAGKLLHDFEQHTAPVTTVEFHPNEFLLASGSADRTVKYWDLESFDNVGSTQPEAKEVKCILFHPETTALYSGGEDSLRVYSWEPVRCFDSLTMGWGRVADMQFAQNQLIGASFSQTNVSTYVVDIQRIQPLGGPSSDMGADDASPPSLPVSSSHPRRSFGERPHTSSSKQAPDVQNQNTSSTSNNNTTTSTTERQPRTGRKGRAPLKEDPSEESGAAGGAAEEEDDNPGVDIKDPKDFKDVFQTRSKISRSPSRTMDPFPAPMDDVPSPVRQTSPKAARPTSGGRNKPTEPASSSNGQRKQSPPERKKPPPSSSASRKTSPPARKNSPSPPSRKKVQSRSPPSSAQRKPDSPKQQKAPPPVVSRSQDRSSQDNHSRRRDDDGGINPDDFLPKGVFPSSHAGRGDGSRSSAVTEAEATNSMCNGHVSMMTVMNSRGKNLHLVRALWTGNTKTAIDSAIGMNDPAILVDMLNVLNSRPNLWNLDMCATLVPQFHSLISSKYETYQMSSMTSLKIVLKNFATVIKSNMSAPPSIGVDITREERYHKCKDCYRYLMEIRSELSHNKNVFPSNAPHVRELNMMLAQLD